MMIGPPKEILQDRTKLLWGLRTGCKIIRFRTMGFAINISNVQKRHPPNMKTGQIDVLDKSFPPPLPNMWKKEISFCDLLVKSRHFLLSQESERSCICVLGISNLPISTIFLLNFWNFSDSVIFFCCWHV
jgi:hypothetical protein